MLDDFQAHDDRKASVFRGKIVIYRADLNFKMRKAPISDLHSGIRDIDAGHRSMLAQSIGDTAISTAQIKNAIRARGRHDRLDLGQKIIVPVQATI